MPSAPCHNPPRIRDDHHADLAFWARLLDENPEEVRRAVRHAGSELPAVRTFLSGRQLGLDFEPATADVAAIAAAHAQG